MSRWIVPDRNPEKSFCGIWTFGLDFIEDNGEEWCNRLEIHGDTTEDCVRIAVRVAGFLNGEETMIDRVSEEDWTSEEPNDWNINAGKD